MSGDIRYSSGKIIFVNGVALTVPIRATEPVGSNGDIYYNSASNKFRKYENGAWSDWGSGGGGSGVNINKFTLSGTDVSNKFVILSSTPSTPSNVILFVIGSGAPQDYGVDFTMSGNQLTWTGMGLDGVLANGDKFIVQFD